MLQVNFERGYFNIQKLKLLPYFYQKTITQELYSRLDKNVTNSAFAVR